MALDAKPFTITLTEEEANELLQVAQSGGPAQQVQAFLQEQLANGNRTLTLTDPQIGRLIRFMTQGPSAVQMVLKRSFKRPLLEAINAA